MFTLVKHDDAIADLEALWQRDIDAAAYIEAFLEQLENDQYLLDSLTVQKFFDDTMDVQHFAEHWGQGRNLWRLKFIEFDNPALSYRIIYAFEPSISRYHILGVVNRDFGYRNDDDRTRRIIAAYTGLDIPSY